VGERRLGDGDPQVGGVREIGGAEPAGLVDLAEEHLLGRPVLGPPLLEPPLQRPQLAVREAPGVLPLQPAEQSLGFQARVEHQLFLQERPNVGEGVGPGSPGMVHAHLAGQLAEPPILACRLVVHAGFGGRLAPRPALQVEAAQSPDLLIGDHPKPP
jgi:hypothetical protein